MTSGELQRDAAAHERLHQQFELLMAGQHAAASQLSGIIANRSTSSDDAHRQLLAELFGRRRSIRAGIVRVSAERPETKEPMTFGYHRAGGTLPRLARPVSDGWRRLLSSVSSASVAGRRLTGSQGRNLATIVDMLRRRCYLRVDGDDRPVQTREVVTVVVDGGGEGRPGFAAECGLGVATFYRALQHPLAHAFLRSQKVQAERDGQRVNVATRFTVALFDPAIPQAVTDLLWAEPVMQDEVFVVQDYTYQDARVKEDLKNSVTGAVDNSGGTTDPQGRSADAARRVQQWEDSAPLTAPRASGESAEKSVQGGGETFHMLNPAVWELATQIALNLGERSPRAAAVTYYRALVWLGEDAVRAEFQAVHRQLDKPRKRPIEQPGAMLTARLNRLARQRHGYRVAQLDIEGHGLAD